MSVKLIGSLALAGFAGWWIFASKAPRDPTDDTNVKPDDPGENPNTDGTNPNNKPSDQTPSDQPSIQPAGPDYKPVNHDPANNNPPPCINCSAPVDNGGKTYLPADQ